MNFDFAWYKLLYFNEKMKFYTLSSLCSSFLTSSYNNTQEVIEKNTSAIKLLELEISWIVQNCFAKKFGEKTIFASSFLDKNIIIEEMRFRWLFMLPYFEFVSLSHTLFMIKCNARF